MGYTTDFSGQFNMSRNLTEAEELYINTFSGSRRMKRDVKKLMEKYKGQHGYPHPELLEDKSPEAVYGHEGEYFAKDDGQSGQSDDGTILDYNNPAGQKSFSTSDDFMERWNENQKRIKEGACQPGLRCQWAVEHEETTDSNGTQYKTILMWDGGEKFYEYVAWLKYLIVHFFEKWGVKLNGTVEWVGEDPNDRGRIIVEDNEVRVQKGNEDDEE